MKDYIRERTVKESEILIKKKCTIRDIADDLNISKSTVHLDLTNRLPRINYNLYKKVRDILDYNKEQRARRGGLAKWKKKEKN